MITYSVRTLRAHFYTLLPGVFVRPEELHSLSAGKQQTENVPSLCSDKVAPPPCAAYAAIPCVLAVRKQHKMLFAASKFYRDRLEVMKIIS